MARIFNLARMTTSTTGTGAITLGSAMAGFLSFDAAGVEDQDVVTYAIQDGTASEIGRGTYTASGTTLSRSVLKSTNSDNAISLSGSAQVFITAAAEDFEDLLRADDNLASVDDADEARANLSVMPRNLLINGCMRFNRRAASSNADDTYGFDRWNILTQTGTVAVSQQTLIEDGWPYAQRITQSQATAQRFGTSQIVAAEDCYRLRGSDVTLSARVRMSVSTTLRYAILEWTGTANSVTSDVVDDWTDGTFTAGNFFIATTLTVTATGSLALTANTPANVSLSGTLGSSLTNVIVLFWTDSTQAQNVTLDIGKVQFEVGSAASPWEYRSLVMERHLCDGYYQKSYQDTTAAGTVTNSGRIIWDAPGTSSFHLNVVTLGASMRAAPTVTLYSTQTGDAAKLYNIDSGSDVAAVVDAVSPARFQAVVNNVSLAEPRLSFHFTADAEL